MGTRSRIGVMHGDKVKSVYCHWDGYLEHNGRILQEHYDSAKANHLVALGDLSSLKPEIGEEHPFGYHGTDMSAAEYNTKFSDMCTFYGRDRGETGTDFKVTHTFAEFLEQADGCYVHCERKAALRSRFVNGRQRAQLHSRHYLLGPNENSQLKQISTSCTARER